MFGRKRRQRREQQAAERAARAAYQEEQRQAAEAANDARLAELWEWASQYAHHAPMSDRQTCLGYIRLIRQHARRGTKALVQWWPNAEVIPTWFWNAWPHAGCYVVATGNLSFGTQDDQTVFYVEPGECRVISGGAPAAYQRHIERQAQTETAAVEEAEGS
jgi:hypothetical protein